MRTDSDRARTSGLFFGVGALGAALAPLASLACCIPLFAALLGATATIAGSAIEPLRPALTILALVACAASLWLSRRTCTRDCRATTTRRWLPLVLAGLTVSTLAFPYLYGIYGRYFV